MNTIAERMKEARLQAGLTQAALAKRVGISQSTIGNFEGGRGEAPRKLLAIAAALGVRPEWLETGEKPQRFQSTAHPLSVSNLTPPAQQLEWGDLMKNALPKAFKVAAPDDSMAPRLRAGQFAEFETGVEPRPGDGVLVADAEGDCYIRLYRQGRQGRWEAHAENAAFQTLDAERDGLKVLAVLVSVHARWG